MSCTGEHDGGTGCEYMNKLLCWIRICVFCVTIFLVSGTFGDRIDTRAATVASESIGKIYSETENGEAVIGLRINLDDKKISYAYDVWKYCVSSGWQFLYSNLEGKQYNDQRIHMGHYQSLLEPNGSNNRIMVVTDLLKSKLPEEYMIETIRFQMGKEISREYEYSADGIAGCLSSEYSLMLKLLQGGPVRYGGCRPQEISCIYNIYTGMKIGESGDIVLNATGASISGRGEAYYRNNRYIVQSLPTAVREQDRYQYEFDGWYTKSEGGEKIEIGSAIEQSQQLYAHWKITPIKYTVTCIDLLEPMEPDQTGIVLGSSTWEAEYGETVSGAAIGSSTQPGEYYTGREYIGCTRSIVETEGARVCRFFKNSMMTVTCIDLVNKGPDTGRQLGMDVMEAPYTSTVSGGAFGCQTVIGTYYPGYQYQSASLQKVVNGGCTVYRYFSPVHYEIQFVANGASGGSMSAIKNCYYGHAYTLTKNSFWKRSKLSLDCNAQDAVCDTSYQYVYHDFAGWSEQPDGGVMYSDCCTVYNLCDNPGEKKLYAVWSDKEVTVTAQPKRLGYEFAGWSRNPLDSSGKKQFQVDGNETLYAIWKPATVKYHVEYYKQKSDQSFEREARYEFDAYTGKKVQMDDIHDMYPGFWLDEGSSCLKGTAKADGSLVLTAFFRRGKYTIDFDLNGGKIVEGKGNLSSVTGLFEQQVTIPDMAVEKEGYDFGGWGVSKDSRQAVAEKGEKFLLPNHDQTLYAVWIPRKDTAFSILPYYENISGNGYIQGEPVKLSGATNSTMEEGICTYYHLGLQDCICEMFGNGYELHSKEQLERKLISGDGKGIAAVYLSRKRYQFFFGTGKEKNEDTMIAEACVLFGQIFYLPDELEPVGEVKFYQGEQGETHFPGEPVEVKKSRYFRVISKGMSEEPVEPQITWKPGIQNTMEPQSTPVVQNTLMPQNTLEPQEPSGPQNSPGSQGTPDVEATEIPDTTTGSNLKDSNGQMSIISTWIGASPSPDEIRDILAKKRKQGLLKKGTSFIRKGIVYRVIKSDERKRTVKVMRAGKATARLVIPDCVSVNGYSYQVTEIKSSAFAGNKKLGWVVIGKNVQKIGKKAFYGDQNLRHIVIKAKNIKSIGRNAWKGIAKQCRLEFGEKCSRQSKQLMRKASQ